MATSNTGYALNTNKWFLGQVPPGQNQHSKTRVWDDVHGDRVKVRIPGMHPMSFPGEDKEVTDDNLPWAIVAKPTTHGNRNAQSTGLWGGEWVIGFFMDEDCQIPVITQVLGNNENYYEILRCENGTTLGKRVGRYNGGRNPTVGEVKGGSNPNSPAQPTKKEMQKAVKDPEPDPTSQTDTEQEAVTEDPEEFTGNQVSPTSSGGGSSGSTTQTAADVLNRDPQSISQYGTRINNTPTAEQLEQFKSSGLTFTPNTDGSPGGKVNNPKSLLGG